MALLYDLSKARIRERMPSKIISALNTRASSFGPKADEDAGADAAGLSEVGPVCWASCRWAVVVEAAMAEVPASGRPISRLAM